MNLSNPYIIGFVSIVVGLCIKITAIYLQINYLFNVGLGVGTAGWIILVVLFIKKRREKKS